MYTNQQGQNDSTVQTYSQNGYDVIVETTTRTYKRKHDNSVPRHMATIGTTTNNTPPTLTAASSGAALAVYRKSMRDGSYVSPSITGLGVPDKGSDTAAVRAAAKDLSLNLWFPESKPSFNASAAAALASASTKKNMIQIDERAREQQESTDQYASRPPHPDAASAATYAPFQMLLEERQMGDQMNDSHMMTLDNQSAKRAALSALRFGDQPQDLAKQALPDAYAWGEREQGANRDSYMGISGPELGTQAIQNASQDKHQMEKDFEGFYQPVENPDTQASRAAALHARSAAQSVTRNIEQNFEDNQRMRRELHENAMPDASLGATRANALARDKSIRQARASSFKDLVGRSSSDYGAIENVGNIEAQARERARRHMSEIYANDGEFTGRQRSTSMGGTTNAHAALAAGAASSAARRRTSTIAGPTSGAVGSDLRSASLSHINLMNVAQRNVSRTLINQDRNISGSNLFLNTDYNARAWQIAESRSQKRMGYHDKIDVGGGLFMTQDEIQRIAQRNVQPVLSEINTKTAQQREDDEMARQQKLNEKEAKKLSKAEKKAKNDEKKRLKSNKSSVKKAEKARLKAEKKHSKESAKVEKARLKAQQEEAKLGFEAARAEVRRSGTVRTRALAELEAAKIAQARAKDPAAVERATAETERKQLAYDEACSEFAHAQGREEAGLKAMEKASEQVAAAAKVPDDAAASETRVAAGVEGAGVAGASLARTTSSSSSSSIESFHTTNEVTESGMLGRNKSMRSVRSNKSGKRSSKKRSKNEAFVPGEPGTPHYSEASIAVAPLPRPEEAVPPVSEAVLEEQLENEVPESAVTEQPSVEPTESEILAQKARAEGASHRTALEAGVAHSGMSSARPGGVVAAAAATSSAAATTSPETTEETPVQTETPAATVGETLANSTSNGIIAAGEQAEDKAIEHVAGGPTKEYVEAPGTATTAKEALEPLEQEGHKEKKGMGSWMKEHFGRKSKAEKKKKKKRSSEKKKSTEQVESAAAIAPTTAAAAAAQPIATAPAATEPTSTTPTAEPVATTPAVTQPNTVTPAVAQPGATLPAASEPTSSSVDDAGIRDVALDVDHTAHNKLQLASEAEMAGAGHQRQMSDIIKSKEHAQQTHADAITHGVATMRETASRGATPISGTPVRGQSPAPEQQGSQLRESVLTNKASKSSMATAQTSDTFDTEGSRAAKVSFNRVRD